MYKKWFEKIALEDDSMIQCKCGNIMEFSPGQPDYNQKDDNGKKLSRKAAEHMSNHRARWNSWCINFCVQWKIDPYHIGFTCKYFTWLWLWDILRSNLFATFDWRLILLAKLQYLKAAFMFKSQFL